MCKKDLILFISIFCVLALISGSTFAYWGWSSNTNKSVVFNTAHGMEQYITYDEGESLFAGNLQSVSYDNFCEGGASTTVTFNKSQEISDVDLVASIYVDVNRSIDSSNVKWALFLGNTADNCISGKSRIASGSFSGISNGQTIELVNNIDVLEEEQSYTLWIWLSENDASLSGQTLDVNVWTKFDMLPSDACLIHYSGDDYDWVQQITDGQSFMLQGGYSACYKLDNNGNTTGSCLEPGQTVAYPCGTVFSCNYGDLC